MKKSNDLKIILKATAIATTITLLTGGTYLYISKNKDELKENKKPQIVDYSLSNTDYDIKKDEKYLEFFEKRTEKTKVLFSKLSRQYKNVKWTDDWRIETYRILYRLRNEMVLLESYPINEGIYKESDTYVRKAVKCYIEGLDALIEDPYDERNVKISKQAFMDAKDYMELASKILKEAIISEF